MRNISPRRHAQLRSRAVGGIALALAMLSQSGQAFAQSADQGAEPPPPQEEPSTPAEGSDQRADEADLVVTGSRIRGIASTGSNVISLGREALTQTGAVTTQDLINQVPQNAGTGFNESTFTSPFGGINSTRGGAVNLRGVGPQATLLLLDGHRMVPNGTSGTLIDPSALPANALERIEIVADGASAIYGADAVAGVVNLILRRNLDGVEVNTRYALADGGMNQFSAGVVVGHSWASGRILLAYEYTYRSRLQGQDRDWYTSDNRARGGTDYRASQCNPGTVQLGVPGGPQTFYPIPSGTVTSATLVAGPANRCDLTPFGDILPQQRRHAIAGTFSQEITDWLSVYAEGQYLSREFTGQFVSQGGSSTNTSFVIPNTNPYFIRPAGTTATSETINYSFLPQYGPLTYVGSEETYNLIGGFNITLPASWKMSIGGVYGYNHSISTNEIINIPSLTAARTSTNPATALNPFGPNSPALLNEIYSGIFEPDGTSRIRTVEARADGPLFALPGGMVRAAIGAEYVHTTFFGGTRRGTLAVPTFAPASISRKARSVYGELFVPIFGADNATGGFESLTLSAAVRRDDYDDFGVTTNPKLGLTWRPVDGLEFHGSYGTSFRAPTLNDTITLRPGALISGATRADPLAGNAQVPVAILIFGNPDIQPEEATTWSIGATLAPRSIPGLRLNVNYFSLLYDKQIVSVVNDLTILQRADVFASVIRRLVPPLTAAQVLADPMVAPLNALLVASGASNTLISPTFSYIIDGRPQNLGKTETEGVDFDLSYHTNLGSGTMRVGVTGSYFFNYKVQQTSTAPVIDQLNRLNYPLQFRARGTLGWNSDRFDGSVYINYANAYENPASTIHPSVSSFTTVDLHLGYRLPFVEAIIALDVNNVFDRDPPFVDIDGAYDPTQASPIGRLVSLSIRASF